MNKDERKGRNLRPKDNPFVDLAPDERIQIVHMRLEHTKDLLLEVIRLNEQRRAIVPIFDQYWAATPDNTIVTFVVTIVQFEISHVCRLWDGAELSGYGLPSIAALLDSHDVLRLVAKRIEAGYPGGAQNAAKLEPLKAALDLIGSAEISDTLKCVRNHRHKHIAHPILKTRQERNQSFELAQAADNEELIAIAIKAISTLAWAASGQDVDYEAFRLDAQSAAQHFFGSVQWPPPDF
ncbi:hypothetical protein [Microvirga zambiensis]|uniref:AbiU2 domain-containing protein n=1 Tax=Microvirga zambiensis TaxID=1402137 RepID=UPI00191DBFD3|nr:hypothetical protein [Microvirga zambiensis]